MAGAKIPYMTVRRNGRAFFELGSRRARDAGWVRDDGSYKSSIPLGHDGPAAEAHALELYHAYLSANCVGTGLTTPPSSEYVKGSLGRFFDHYRKSAAWARKKPRTRDDYVRAWPTIADQFGNTDIHKINAARSEDFHHELRNREQDGTLSPAQRYRILKIWRALLGALQRAGLVSNAPIGGVSNPQPAGRTDIWVAGEIKVLIEKASEMGFHGMSLAIWIGWETLYSPVDVRSLKASQLRSDAHGAYFEQTRAKTGKESFATISGPLHDAIQKYLSALDMFVTPDAPFLRQRNGNAYRSKDTFSDDFRSVRNKAFPGDRRQFMDIRRSGNVEADLGGATAEERGSILANNIATNTFLNKTYTPPTVAKNRQIAKKRELGRECLQNEAGTKVGTTPR
jgi:hypothetical protein